MALTACAGQPTPTSAADIPSQGSSTSTDARPAEALLSVERSMTSWRDATFRGTWEASDESGFFSGHALTTTLRVTADGRCEVVRETADGLRQTKKNVDGTTWFNWSDEYLALLSTDRQEQWRGRWESDAADPIDACDVTHLSAALDLDTVEAMGSTTIAGRAAQEYSAVAANPNPESDGVVRFWITTDDRPVVVQVAGDFASLKGPVTLVSTTDGLEIPRPPRRLWVQH